MPRRWLVFLLAGMLCGCALLGNLALHDLEGASPGSAARFFYPSEDGTVEAYLIRPRGKGPFPLAVLLHGHSMIRAGATRVLPVAEELSTKLCYAALAVSLPGYGNTSVPGDDSDRELIQQAVLDGIAKVAGLTWIDGKRILLYGFSRGAVFAATMAGQVPGLSALILHSGAYDLPALYNETESRWVRASLNPDGDAHPRLFSVLPEVSGWSAPTLILHGEKDRLIPIDQAVLLRDRLRTLGKPYHAVIFPEAGHHLPVEGVRKEVIAFVTQHVGSACPVSDP